LKKKSGFSQPITLNYPLPTAAEPASLQITAPFFTVHFQLSTLNCSRPAQSTPQVSGREKPEEKKVYGTKKAFFQSGPTWIKKQLLYRLSPSNFHG
jgi:hypothetical protein